MCVAVWAAVAKVAKKILAILLGDKKGRKFLGYVVGIALFIALLPFIAVYGLFGWMAGGGANDILQEQMVINRLDNGTKYCKNSPTVEETALQKAIVRALNKFNAEDKFTYLTLMKATIGEAIGLNGGSDEIDLLERKMESLNRKILDMVNESLQNGEDVESREEEFKSISEEVEAMKRRIEVIRQSEQDDEKLAERLETIQKTIAEREANKNEYDDSIVRQMVECIKVYRDGRIEVIFGGGTLIEEQLNPDEE